MAAVKNFDVDQYADWVVTITWQDPTGTPINITNYTALLNWKATPTSAPVLSLANGSGITITGSTGVIAIHATAAQMGAIAAGSYSYDLVLTAASGVATRLIQGTINLGQGISYA